MNRGVQLASPNHTEPQQKQELVEGRDGWGRDNHKRPYILFWSSALNTVLGTQPVHNDCQMPQIPASSSGCSNES